MRSLKILVAPLDWGLGHATRCIPVINELLSHGCAVWIATGGSSLQLLRKEFPLASFLPLEGYRVFYHTAKNDFRYTIARQIPKIRACIRQEHAWIEEMMDEHHFDIIISDNRYGLYSKKAYSVFITHQLNIRTGMGALADLLLQKINYRYIQRFDACWVPDFEGPENLAGGLSHPATLPPRTRYIGALSRLDKKKDGKKYDLLIILSGPEPRRTIWEQALLKELETYNGNTLVVRGLPGNSNPINAAASVQVVDFFSSDALSVAIRQSEWVVCRSGYTSVMDLVQVQHKAILIPTPGQPEQEYLATWLHQNKVFYTCTEDTFTLPQSLHNAATFPFDFSMFLPRLSAYKKHIDELLRGVRHHNSVQQ